MSGYNGRRGPNVSLMLRDLNTISPQDSSSHDNDFLEQDDLGLFTNTQFFDMESGLNMDFHSQSAKVDSDNGQSAAASTTEDAPGASIVGDMSTMDFMAGEFGFSDFTPSGYGAPAINSYNDGTSFQPLQPSHGSVFPPTVPSQQQQFTQAVAPRGTDKRKSDAITTTTPSTPVGDHSLNFEEASRQAAEEDKRRRNTAASARFRIKKKQREQALEKSAKEASEKISGLESRVSQLETENKWLKNLLVDKNEGAEDITALWKEFTKQAAKRTKPEAGKVDGKAHR